ncbi:hypothetical protein [Epilithonimonas hispanica]|uniref:Uncharacterized protein n=1 Tax=Epilithonimonas hispanica TaxID=358687 RepID=A0A3D9CZJ0_9FLAO|nr:hypothetical protein [Epilithonimonas hispanica]REC71176.1 hypothetical protein DRF58_06490 [Epilithonimonas hispanica]
MKKLLLVATFAVAGVTGSLSAKSKPVTITKSFLQAEATTCYRKAIDDFGNTYYVKVTCPKKIILAS